MLKDVINEDIVQLRVDAKDWQEAIRLSSLPMVETGVITQNYVEEMIKGVIETGPYIVITEHIAMPHARSEHGALKSGIGVTSLKTPVEFGHTGNDPVKYVFTLSSTDNEQHLQNISNLVVLLEMPEFFEVLDKAEDAKEIIDYISLHNL